jgi:hypothetical protein
MSVSSVRAHLTESLKLLGGGDAADERHRTMRASLAWSYDPLVEADQQLLRRLAVFAGTFTLEAAARVAADASDALDVLDPVGRWPRRRCSWCRAAAATSRAITFPRRCGNSWPSSSSAMPTRTMSRKRHALWFLELAKREMAALHRRDMAVAMMRLDRDAANFSAAHRWCMQAPDASYALELAHALVPY